MSARHRAFLPAVLVVALSASASNAAGRSVQSPCKLAAPADVKAAFGGKVGAGTADTSIPGAPVCRYDVKASNLGLSGAAVVFVTPGQTSATFALAKKLVPGAVSVSGVGNGAFYNPHTTSVEFLKGNVVASAQAIFLDPGGPGVDAAKVKADVIRFAKSVARHV